MADTGLDQNSSEIPEPKRKKSNSARDEISVTIRNPTWAYIHLELVTTAPSSTPLDAITARTHLTSALKQFLGLTGSAIPIDILKVEKKEVWIRVPREDRGAVVAAVGGCVSITHGRDGESEQMSWRLRGASDWLASLVAGDGSDLFED